MATRPTMLAALLLAACASNEAAPERAASDGATTVDPYGDAADGKSDGGAAFFAARSPHAFALKGGTLSLGEGTRYAGVRRATGPAGEVTISLRAEERLAGMTAVTFVPAGDAALARFAESRLFDALGVVAPRVVAATLSVDAGPARPYLVVETRDARFLKRRFETPDGARFAPGETPEALKAPLAAPGRRAFEAVLDVEATLGFLAGRAVLGGAPGLGLYDACAPESTCLAPLVEAPAGEASAVDALDTLSRGLRTVPALNARHTARLAEALDCVETPACLTAPLKAYAGVAGLDAGPFVQALADRAVALRAGLSALDGADAPDGLPDYRSFTQDDAGTLAAHFRWLPVDAAPATEVALRLGARRVALAFDVKTNLWSGEITGASRATDYDFEVRTADGETRRVADPTGGEGRVDPAAVDRLVAEDDYGLDFPEASGLAWIDDGLVAVSDAKGAIYGVNPADGERTGRLALDFRDLEAVAFDPVTREYLIAPEGRGAILRLSAEGSQVSTNGVKWADDGNSGLEGLAVRADDGHVFAAKEKDPAQIAEFDENGLRLRRVGVDFASDLSELSLGDDGFLYALSDEDQALFRLDVDLDVLRTWPLPMKHPEGLAVHAGRVYVANDGEDRLYVFRLEAR
jgi:hypothetical protein